MYVVYHGSPSNVVMAVFDEMEWLAWRFHRVPKSYWDTIDNQRQYLEWLRELLGFTDMEDLYLLKCKHVCTSSSPPSPDLVSSTVTMAQVCCNAIAPPPTMCSDLSIRIMIGSLIAFTRCHSTCGKT